MPNVRKIWHLQAQSAQHQRIVNPGIANFFAILLQYNSKGRIHCSSIFLKIIYIYLYIYIFHDAFFLQNFSLISLIIYVLFSLFILCFSICSLIFEASLLKFLTHLRNFSPISKASSPKFLSNLRNFSPIFENFSSISIAEASHGLSLISHCSSTDSPSPISKSLCRFTHRINPTL